MVCHLWPSGDCFVFNCCYHWSLLIFRNGNGAAVFLHSREGMTQGDPLAMVAYGIGVLPPIKKMRVAYPDVTHPWYADDAGSLGTFNNIGLYFNSLKTFGQDCGYFPKP